MKRDTDSTQLKAENERLRDALALIMPLAECYVARLESDFEESDDDGALYADWQDALAALGAAKDRIDTGTMNDRRYTVAEIDALKDVCENMVLFGSYREGESGVIPADAPSDKSVAVEQMVRAHMIAGRTAEDLLATDKRG